MSPEAGAIRRYRCGDQASFAALVNACHAEYGFSFDPVLDADLLDPQAFYEHVWVLAAGDGPVVGSVALTPPDGSTVTLKRMYLRADLRGRGYGSTLLETAIATARAEGRSRILLDTSTAQLDARRLYERAGFVLAREDGGTLYYSLDLR